MLLPLLKKLNEWKKYSASKSNICTRNTHKNALSQNNMQKKLYLYWWSVLMLTIVKVGVIKVRNKSLKNYL